MITRVPIKAIYSTYNWFVLRVKGASETKAMLYLDLYGSAHKIPDYELIQQLWVPQAPIAPKSNRWTALTSGYIFVKAVLSYKLYSALKEPDIPCIFGWLQQGKSWPSIVPVGEIRKLAMPHVTEFVAEELPTVFFVGDVVDLLAMGLKGTVSKVAEAYVIIDIFVFNRSVPYKVRREAFHEVVVSKRK